MAKMIRRLLTDSSHNSLFVSLVHPHISLIFLLLGSTRSVGLLFLSLFLFCFSISVFPLLTAVMVTAIR